MIRTSTEYRKAVLENRKFLVKLNITLSDGVQLPVIENSLLMSGGLKFDDAVSSASTLDVGAAIINQCTVLLNNSDEHFSAYDFRGARIQVKIGLQLSSTVEWIDKGTYYVESSKTTGVAIAITALDYMLLFDKSYSESKLEYPASLLEIYRDACNECGVAMGTTHFTNDNYVVKNRPNDEALTFREIISYMAQIACCFARINNAGALEIRWYDHNAMENEANLWGGNNIDYTTGDSAHGGDFSDYTSRDNCYGGDFVSHYSFHHFYRLINQNIETDDVVVTGVRVVEEKADGDMGEPAEYFVGEEGYVIEFKNVLIQQGEGEVIANLIGNELIGFRFRPLSISVQYDPSIEAGDCAYVTDRKMNVYRTIVSSVSGGIGGAQAIKADAETPAENTSIRYSQSVKNYLDARIAAKQEVNRYDTNVQKLNEIMSNSLGFYTTYEVQEDGSKIKYVHDKPLLTDSQVIYKQTIDAYAVSTDGGATWNFGYTKDGNIIAQTLSVIGINADWLTVGGYNNADGVITVKDASGAQFIRIGKDGILMSNGAKLMGGNGVLSNIQVDSVDYR